MKPWARSEGLVSVKLSGRPPWGFRLQGGMGTGEPLKVYKVRKKGKSFNKIFVGDIILNVNGYSCERLTYSEAMRIADAGAPDLALQVIRSSAQSRKVFVKRKLATESFSNGKSDNSEKATRKVTFQVTKTQKGETRSVSLPYAETVSRKHLQKSYSFAKPPYLSRPGKISGKFSTMEEDLSPHESVEGPDEQNGNTEETSESLPFDAEQATSEAENYFSMNSTENTDADEQLEEFSKESEVQSGNSEEYTCDDGGLPTSPENVETLPESQEQSFETDEVQSGEAVSSACSEAESTERTEESDAANIAESETQESAAESDAVEESACEETASVEETEEAVSTMEQNISTVTRSEVEISSETCVQESVSESTVFSETVVQESYSETESETYSSEEIIQETVSVSQSETVSSEVIQEKTTVSVSETISSEAIQETVSISETVSSAAFQESATISSEVTQENVSFSQPEIQPSESTVHESFQEERVIEESQSISKSQMLSSEVVSEISTASIEFDSSQVTGEQLSISQKVTASSEIKEQGSAPLDFKPEISQEEKIAATEVIESVLSAAMSETSVQENIQTVENSSFISSLSTETSSETVQTQEIISSQTSVVQESKVETYATNLAEFEAHILEKLDKVSKFNIKKFEPNPILSGSPLPIDEILNKADSDYQLVVAQIEPLQLAPISIPSQPLVTTVEMPSQIHPPAASEHLVPADLPPLQPVASESNQQTVKEIPPKSTVTTESEANKPKKVPPPVPPKPSRKIVNTPDMNGTVEIPSVGMGALPTDSCKEGNFNINPKVYKPPVEMDNSEITMLTRKKKMFSSSSFYEEPNCIYPTVEEQVQLCRKIADSLSADTNRKSKGASMFYKRVKRSETWVHEAQGQRNGETWFSKSNDTGLEPSTPDLANRPYIRVSKGPPQLKLILDPRHIIDMKTLQQEGIIINEHNTITPDICLGIVRDLNSPTGKGAQMFARRKKKSEEWVVDEDKVKSSLSQRQIGKVYSFNENPHTWVQTAASQWEKFTSSTGTNYVGSYVDVHPDKVAETVIRAAENKISSIPEEREYQHPPPLQLSDQLPPLQPPEPLPPLQPPEPLPQFPFQEILTSTVAVPRPSTPSFKPSLYSANPYKPRSPKPWAGTTEVSSSFSHFQSVEMPVYTPPPPPPPPVMSDFPPPVTAPLAPVRVPRQYSFQNFNTLPRAWQGAEARHHPVLFRPVKAPSL